jgi:uncharacterized protein with PQ loop repeat
MIEYADYIGLIAGLIFSTSSITQAIKIIKMKGGESISVMTYAMMIAGMSLWTVYAVMHEAWMFVFWNSLAIVMQLVVIGLTIYYTSKRRVMPDRYERRAGR